MKALTLHQPWASLVALGVCSVPECDRGATRKGWCGKHYQRWWKHGSPNATGKTPPGEQFAFLVQCVAQRDRSTCWPWPYSKRKGYGTLRDLRTGRTAKAHRLAYELANGRVLDALGCHTCDDPGCFNPAHVFDGTQVDNMQDAKSKGRLSPPPNRWAT